MLHHEETAIAIQLLLGGTKYKQHYFKNLVYMTIIAARTVQEIGYTGDIVVLTNTSEYDDLYKKEGLIIEHREIFDYPALHDYKCNAHGLSIFDMQKIQYWSLYRYKKVLGIDNDFVAIEKFDKWGEPEVGVCFINDNHINSGMLLVEPSESTFQDMRETLRTARFSPEMGWNNCEQIGIVKNWNFQAANAAQGFIPYYFYNRMTFINPHKYFIHYAGPHKYINQEYQALVKKHGFELEVPNHLKSLL